MFDTSCAPHMLFTIYHYIIFLNWISVIYSRLNSCVFDWIEQLVLAMLQILCSLNLHWHPIVAFSCILVLMFKLLLLHYICLIAFFPGQPGLAGKSGFYWSKRWWGDSGISWTICKSFAPRSRQITKPVPHHSVFTSRMPFLLLN